MFGSTLISFDSFGRVSQVWQVWDKFRFVWFDLNTVWLGLIGLDGV